MKPVFIGGCDRSGTTLLGSLLGGHSACLCVPEMPFKFGLQRRLECDGGDVSRALDWLSGNWRFRIWGVDLDPSGFVQEEPSARGVIESVVEEYGRKVGEPGPRVWVDHTPENIQQTQSLVDLFPEARLVHIVRDGRAVANSLMPLDWGPNEIGDMARYWADWLARGFAAELFWGPERIIRVRYEDLVREPEATLQRLCRHLGIEYEPEMAQGNGFVVPTYTAIQHSLVGSSPDPLRVDAWRNGLTPRQVEIFESITADLLLCLGYSLGYGVQARQLSRKERILSRIHDYYRKVMNWRRARRRIRLGLARR